jgi:hypothetical protein
MHTFLKKNFDIFKQKLDADIREIPQVFQAKYLSGLDGLRAISITFVVLAHSLLGKAWEHRS